MKRTLTILVVLISQLIFGQNEDYPIIKLDEIDSSRVSSEVTLVKDVWNLDQALQEKDSLMLVMDQIEISTLNSNKDHREYLSVIWKLDQGIREIEMNVASEFGYRSKKHDSIVAVSVALDRILFNKMREYLSIHPFPDKDEVRGISGQAILTVFHHVAGTPEDIDLKKMYFPTFYKAYEQGNLYAGDLWMFLFRLYKQIKNEDYVNQELGDEGQIKEMIRILELKTK